ncbi:MAG: hypothetical protein HKN33_01855 [Pyrinomonadaceae bacterium]|nr:hypothetical protein [Pyrinomonadaceae bacterium]
MGTSKFREPKTSDLQSGLSDADLDALRRLEILRVENSKLEADLNGSTSTAQQIDSEYGIDTEKAVARLGLVTGLIPTTAIFTKALLSRGDGDPGLPFLLTFIFVLAVTVTSITGYWTGKVTGKVLKQREPSSWPMMLIELPFFGFVWGLVSGTAGGLMIMGIGAIFGGIIGASVGALVLTVFGVLHRLLKEGDEIDSRKAWPITVGINAVIAALILGL